MTCLVHGGLALSKPVITTNTALVRKRDKPVFQHFDWAFKKEYILARFREEKQKVFMELQQGDMTLAELRQKFEHLAQFAPTLVSTPVDRIEEFRKRLSPDVRPYVSTVITTDFSETYDLMAKAEKDVDDLKASMDDGGAGSTLSYICVPMPEKSEIQRGDMEYPMVVSNPLGHSMRLHHLYRNCPLMAQGHRLSANLIELPYKEFDIILDPSHVLPEGEVTLDESLTYEEEPIQILAREAKELRNKTVPLVKVLW
ncbi:unnamed protein product [Cuscuta campestris]|uniref:Retrotransposon gag domain-containing protein n=1 Tax=Cuscuta campestris TaxID=132261 RepID=A0A484N9P5_9ASTE|nr:unnamed protein product [Cuscuta campestris]